MPPVSTTSSPKTKETKQMSAPIIKSGAESAHWYTRDGQPMHTVIGSSTGRPRPTNITDARKLNLLPSVTAITRILDKPALTRWKCEQAVLAAMTTPRIEGEPDDVFIDRVLNVEKQHEQEAETARNLGTDIHAAIEGALNGQRCSEELAAYVGAARRQLEFLKAFDSGVSRVTECVVIGDGYAGKQDLKILGVGQTIHVDFKTTKNLPKCAYPENAMQLAAYAMANPKHYESDQAANIFISTTEPGKAMTIMHDKLDEAYQAFRQLLAIWKWLNKF